jgi:hypothetical protein
MSEFYELLTPDMYHLWEKENIFPLECMICYEQLDLSSPVAIFPCFHMMHVDCATKTIEMSFQNAIHPNTILPTWEFHCPQRDSSESLGEKERRMKDLLERGIKPSIPRCTAIPIPNQNVEEIRYFSIPYVIQWYALHNIFIKNDLDSDENIGQMVYMAPSFANQLSISDSTFFTAFRFMLLLLCLFYLPSYVWVGLIIYTICKYFTEINELMNDENRLFRLLVTGIFIYASYQQEL